MAGSMFCPMCGADSQSANAYCKRCGEWLPDIRARTRHAFGGETPQQNIFTGLFMSHQAMSKSLPVKIASTLDAYLENRYQQNLRSGVVNLIAFVALLAVGSGHFFFGWTKVGIFMLVLSALSLFFGAWDIWIYRRNLPPIARPPALPADAETNKLEAPHSGSPPPLSVAEPTTKNLELSSRQ